MVQPPEQQNTLPKYWQIGLVACPYTTHKINCFNDFNVMSLLRQRLRFVHTWLILLGINWKALQLNHFRAIFDRPHTYPPTSMLLYSSWSTNHKMRANIDRVPREMRYVWHSQRARCRNFTNWHNHEGPILILLYFSRWNKSKTYHKVW